MNPPTLQELYDESTPGKWKATVLYGKWGVDSYHKVTGEFLINIIKHGSILEYNARLIEELHNDDPIGHPYLRKDVARLEAENARSKARVKAAENVIEVYHNILTHISNVLMDESANLRRSLLEWDDLK